MTKFNESITRINSPGKVRFSLEGNPWIFDSIEYSKDNNVNLQMPIGLSIGKCVVLSRSSFVQHRVIAMELLAKIIYNSRSGFISNQKLFEDFSNGSIISSLSWSDIMQYVFEMGDIIATIRICIDYSKTQVTIVAIKALHALIFPTECDIAAIEVSQASATHFPLFAKSFGRRSLASRKWNSPSYKALTRMVPQNENKDPDISKHESISDQELFAENPLSSLIITLLPNRLCFLLKLFKNNKACLNHIIQILSGIVTSVESINCGITFIYGVFAEIVEILQLDHMSCNVNTILRTFSWLTLLSPPTKRFFDSHELKITTYLRQLLIELEQVSKELDVFEHYETIKSTKRELIRIWRSKSFQHFWSQNANLFHAFSSKILKNLPSRQLKWSRAEMDCFLVCREVLFTIESFLPSSACNTDLMTKQHYIPTHINLISSTFITNVYTIIKDRILTLINTATTEVTHCPTLVLPAINAAFSFLVSVYSVPIDKITTLKKSFFDLNLNHHFGSLGVIRLFYVILNLWRSAILGKNTWQSLLLGAPLSSLIKTIIRTQKVFETSNRPKETISGKLATHVFSHILPEFFDHYQNLMDINVGVPITLNKHFSKKISQITPNEFSPLQLWQISVMNVFGQTREITIDNIIENLSINKKISHLEAISLVIPTLGPGSEKHLMYFLSNLGEIKTLQWIFKIFLENLSAFNAGISNFPSNTQKLQTKKLNLLNLRITSRARWIRELIYDVSYLKNKFSSILSFKNNFERRDVYKRDRLTKLSLVIMNNCNLYMLNIDKSSFPTSMKWPIYRTFDDSKEQTCSDKLSNCRIICNPEPKRLIPNIAICLFHLHEAYAIHYITFILKSLYTFGTRLQNNEKVLCTFMIWNFLSRTSCCPLLKFTNMMTNSFIDRFNLYSKSHKFYTVYTFLLLGKCMSTETRKNAWIKMFQYRAHQKLPIKKILKFYKIVKYGDMLDCMGDIKDLQIVQMCFKIFANDNVKHIILPYIIIHSYALSIVRYFFLDNNRCSNCMFNSTYERNIAKSIHDKTQALNYRNLLLCGHKLIWQEVVGHFKKSGHYL